MVLSEDGHTVDTAANGAEGLQKLSVRPFDLVITDRAMPHMNGDQFATAVRALYPDMPLILLTGFRRSDDGSGRSSFGLRCRRLQTLYGGFPPRRDHSSACAP